MSAPLDDVLASDDATGAVGETAGGRARPVSPHRHPLDPVALGAGLLAVLLAAVYLVSDLLDADVEGGAVAAVVLVALGALVLVAGLRRLPRS